MATLYFRSSKHGVTDVITPLPNDAFLTTKANLTDSQAAGLELVANGRLTKSLTYNASTNLFWSEIDASSSGFQQLLGFAGRRSAFVVGARASLNWQPTSRDVFQVSANVLPKRLLPQGYAEPSVLSYVGYRHKFAENLFAVVTVQDPFDAIRAGQVISTPILRDHLQHHIHLRGIFVGFSRSFGAMGNARTSRA